MTVQEMIDLLNQVQDKSKEVKFYDWYNSDGNNPVFVPVDEAWWNDHEDAFLIS